MAPIIHPWDFHVKYAVDRRRSKISCRFLPLQFVVSYQDLLLAMDIANQLAPLATIGGPSQAPPAPKDTMANEKLYAESIASKGRPLELSVRTSGLEVMVIDDSYGKNVPLIQARVDRLEGRLLGTTDRPLSAITAEVRTDRLGEVILFADSIVSIDWFVDPLVQSTRRSLGHSHLRLVRDRYDGCQSFFLNHDFDRMC